jgi:hypothetical protein
LAVRIRRLGAPNRSGQPTILAYGGRGRMAGMGRAARLAMLERGTQALAALLPQAAGLYACPLCLLGFSADEIEDGGRLTEEHARPDKLDDEVVCLTCADCNHRAGRLLDSHMIRAERLIDFAAGRNTPPLRTGASTTASNDPAMPFQQRPHPNEPAAHWTTVNKPQTG